MFTMRRAVAFLALNGLAGVLLTLTIALAGSHAASTLPRRALLPLLAADSAPGPQAPPGCIVPPTGMVAWYPLDELTGAAAVNDIALAPSSTVNNVGTPRPGGLVGSPNGPNPVSGQVGGAMYFPGTYIEVAPQSDLDFGTGDFTIDAWIRPVTIVDANFLSLIVYKVDSAGIGYALYTQGNQSGGRELKLVMNGTTYTSTALITSTAWYHVAVTVDRSSLSGAFYIDGLPAGTFNPIAGSIDNTAPMLIGASFLPGLLLPNVGRHEITIDELELFNRALTQAEIQAIFNANTAGKCKDTLPPKDPLADLGDAPDSTNNAPGSPAMTAYLPSTQGRFPTVFSSSPPGPKHLQPKAVAWLGPGVSFENEADVGPDQDPTNNIVPILDQADKDLNDDGIVSLPALPTTFCSQIQFTYSVSFAAVTTQPLYVNAWFDFTQDGDWEDSGKCAAGPAITGSFNEWAVQDQVIPPGSGPLTLTVTTPLFTAQAFDPTKDVWMRISLSDQPAVDPPGPPQPDGRGPVAGFKYGETEDWLVRGSPSTRICGIKYNDLNGNGAKDTGEPALPGWTIILTPGSFTTTTDANGSYCFGSLSPGTYTVSEVVQVGWTPTSPPGGMTTVTVPPSATNIDFGNRFSQGQLSEICGTKFNDLNGNGVKDAGEPGLAGWTINLSPGSSTTTTDANGSYCFSSLSPGTYTVSEVVQVGWTPTSPPGGMTTVTVPPSATNIDFGNRFSQGQLSEICGTKFNDLNGNGVKDAGEPGLAGWTISLSPGSSTTTTGANGSYCFGAIPAGTYTVSEVLMPGWTQTLPAGPGTYTVTIPPATTNLNFGNCRPVPGATCLAP
ncbi:MAG: hypothetical protein HYX53_12470 [Chloroflexi bacterium]|nr:hypothetical protein [Chloroflexota bacterium]